MICPSHGVIWRKDPAQIVEKYAAWANAYRENQITLVYDTMWGGTRTMAEHIAKGIEEADQNTTVKLFNLSTTSKNDVITEVFKSKAIAVGSPTINRGILSEAAGILEEIRGLGFKGKKAAAFGCYGWSGESPKMLQDLLQKAGFEVSEETVRCLWQPDEAALAQCVGFGRRLAAAWQGG